VSRRCHRCPPGPGTRLAVNLSVPAPHSGYVPAPDITLIIERERSFVIVGESEPNDPGIKPAIVSRNGSVTSMFVGYRELGADFDRNGPLDWYATAERRKGSDRVLDCAPDGAAWQRLGTGKHVRSQRLKYC
jgi:hypothetical protein